MQVSAPLERDHLVVASWNVNSVKARLAHVLDWLDVVQPDLLGLQELKLPTEEFPHEAFALRGYHAAVHGQKAYNGVALLTRQPLDGVERGIEELAADDQARIISGRLSGTPGGAFDGVRVVDMYVPNGQAVGTDKYRYKLAWLDSVGRHFEAKRRPDEPLIVMGDFNIAPDDRDVYDPEEYRGQVLFSDAEHAALSRLLDWGLVDLFRRFHREGGLYSFWDYRMGAFRRNLGLRIDLVLATAPLLPHALDCSIDTSPRERDRPSDHAPVVARFRAAP